MCPYWSLFPLGERALTCPLGRRRYGLWAPTRWPCRCGHRGCPGHSWPAAEGSQALGLLPGRASSGHLWEEREVDENRPGAEGTGQEGGMGNGILGPQIHSHSLLHRPQAHIHTHNYTQLHLHPTHYNIQCNTLASALMNTCDCSFTHTNVRLSQQYTHCSHCTWPCIPM